MPMVLICYRYPLAAVTELTLGSRARTWVNFLLDLTVFGCGIPNLLVGEFELYETILSCCMNDWHLLFQPPKIYRFSG